MVKGQRTNWKTTDTNGFLDGDLEDCLGSLLRQPEALLEEQALTCSWMNIGDWPKSEPNRRKEIKQSARTGIISFPYT